jgi:hypothetical protein
MVALYSVYYFQNSCCISATEFNPMHNISKFKNNIFKQSSGKERPSSKLPSRGLQAYAERRRRNE